MEQSVSFCPTNIKQTLVLVRHAPKQWDNRKPTVPNGALYNPPLLDSYADLLHDDFTKRAESIRDVCRRGGSKNPTYIFISSPFERTIQTTLALKARLCGGGNTDVFVDYSIGEYLGNHYRHIRYCVGRRDLPLGVSKRALLETWDQLDDRARAVSLRYIFTPLERANEEQSNEEPRNEEQVKIVVSHGLIISKWIQCILTECKSRDIVVLVDAGGGDTASAPATTQALKELDGYAITTEHCLKTGNIVKVSIARLS